MLKGSIQFLSSWKKNLCVQLLDKVLDNTSLHQAIHMDASSTVNVLNFQFKKCSIIKFAEAETETEVEKHAELLLLMEAEALYYLS